MSKVILMLVDPRTYQSDVKDVLESLLESWDTSLLLCLNSRPEYILSRLDVSVRDGVFERKSLHLIDVVSPQKPDMPNLRYLGEGSSLTQIGIEINDMISQLHPKYFIMDSLDSLMGYEDVEKFMQDLINLLNSDSVNSIILVGANNDDNELTQDVQRRVAETRNYSEMKKEAVGWTGYQQA
ncbi:MAG: hypothetical protein V1744_07435 [Candidatus Altiarchaeota archaeon]